MATPRLHEETPHVLEADDFTLDDDADEYGADPLELLERKEQRLGTNCFDQDVH